MSSVEMTMTESCRTALAVILAACAAMTMVTAPAAADPFADLRFELTPRPFGAPAPGLPTDLALDDGTAEGVFGVGIAAARQFLWFSRFDLPAAGLRLEEVQVLFPSGINMTVGDDVQIVVYRDSDGDPTNGADLLATIPGTIQDLDNSFSVYPLTPPLLVTSGSDLLIGVINRFTESGVDAPTSPAALDTTASQGRSYFATWIGDPPDPPSLPSDNVLANIDDLMPGNWMIRAVASPGPALPIPALPTSGLVLLAMLLAIVGVLSLKRPGRCSDATAPEVHAEASSLRSCPRQPRRGHFEPSR